MRKRNKGRENEISHRMKRNTGISFVEGGEREKERITHFFGKKRAGIYCMGEFAISYMSGNTSESESFHFLSTTPKNFEGFRCIFLQKLFLQFV